MGEPQITPTPTEGKTLLLSPINDVPSRPEKSWEEIIPEKFLRKMEEEERTREQLQLYLPPRQRRVQVSTMVHSWRFICSYSLCLSPSELL